MALPSTTYEAKCPARSALYEVVLEHFETIGVVWSIPADPWVFLAKSAESSHYQGTYSRLASNAFRCSVTARHVLSGWVKFQVFGIPPECSYKGEASAFQCCFLRILQFEEEEGR